MKYHVVESEIPQRAPGPLGGSPVGRRTGEPRSIDVGQLERVFGDSRVIPCLSPDQREPVFIAVGALRNARPRSQKHQRIKAPRALCHRLISSFVVLGVTRAAKQTSGPRTPPVVPG